MKNTNIENRELVRDAAGKNPMLSTLSPSYIDVISNDALNNTQTRSIQMDVQSSQIRAPGKFGADIGILKCPG